MLEFDPRDMSNSPTCLTSHATDAQMVGWMRLTLSISALLAIFVDPTGLQGVDTVIRLVFAGYVGHSCLLYMCSQLRMRGSQGKLIHWVDVGWFTIITLCTGGINSFFFLFFFFAILTASFRWGFEEGARVTIVSAVLFASGGLLLGTENDLPKLLVRSAFILTLGYMCAYWGEKKLGVMRQLDLLRDVSRLSNPRFGVDHSITSAMQKTMGFFAGRRCVLVLRDREHGVSTLRMVKAGQVKQSLAADPIHEEIASPLMSLPFDNVVAFSRLRWSPMSLLNGFPLRGADTAKQIKCDQLKHESLATLLEAKSFISAPVSLRKAAGRIYVLSDKINFSKADALFLQHIVAQAFPAIDNVDLLDRMASEAASQQRQKMALDIHDNAIQPYIGLRLALNAIRRTASMDNPLNAALEKLAVMTDEVVDDLRSYSATIRHESRQTESAFFVALKQYLIHIKQFYGTDIRIDLDEMLNVSDRLTAEVLHVIREGLINICKHTLAQRGHVKVWCANGLLQIQIANENGSAEMTPFIPKSISERAITLGGHARVNFESSGNTIVHIEIPV